MTAFPYLAWLNEITIVTNLSQCLTRKFRTELCSHWRRRHNSWLFFNLIWFQRVLFSSATFFWLLLACILEAEASWHDRPFLSRTCYTELSIRPPIITAGINHPSSTQIQPLWILILVPMVVLCCWIEASLLITRKLMLGDYDSVTVWSAKILSVLSSLLEATAI